MTRQELVFRAALTRFALGVFAVVVLPLLYPEVLRSFWVYVLYMAFAALEQVLIQRQIGGRARSFVAGLVDAAVLTYTVHRLGSVATVMASLYFFATAANALVVGLRVGVALALINGLAYSGVVWAERYGALAFAPDVPDVARYGAPTSGQAIAATFLVSTLIVCSTAVVGLLAHALQHREDALVVANEKLVVLSQRDALTGLYNRRHLFERLEHEMARVRRGHPLALLMLDLDGFKRINDTQGHLRGDLLLKELADGLSRTTRAADVVGRYGGDEFMVILPDTDLEQARVAADRVVASAREAGTKLDAARPVTASVGIAMAEPEDTAISILRRADENAYAAKQRGGDRVAS